MKKFAVFACVVLVGCGSLTGTSPTSGPIVNGLTSPAGQLFCAIQQGGGGQIVAGIIAAAAPGAGPIGGPVIVLATNAGAAVVQQECLLAAQAVGGKAGVPVSPPVSPTPAAIAIVPPAGAPVAALPAATSAATP